METIQITVNGAKIDAAPGKTILDVVRERGIDDIPTLCHSPELEPYGSCFVCVVEVKGRPNLVPSCATRIAPGMEIETRSERVVASRRTALEMLVSNHYADCISPCMEGCPAHVDAQGYIALSAMGLPRAAVDLIRESNPFPAVCGRVCVRKCEVVCRRADVDTAVGINAIKRYVTDAPGVYEGTPSCTPATGLTVGIVGAGPAGLTAAWFLGRAGHKAIVYEAQERSGGMLRYGIPSYRLPDDVIDAEVAHICKTGAEIRYGVRVGKDVTLAELMKRHDAVFVGAGAWAGKPMGVKGEFETSGVVTGTDFLHDKRKRPARMSGTVVVVGGGNTAMDVARTSWRLGADKVIILYRRTKAEMPADPMEIRDCLEEGVELMELAAPVGIVSEQGRLKALRCIRMKLGEPDASGRRRPVPLEGSEFDLPCQLAVAAIGQDPILDGLTALGTGTVQTTKWKTFVVDAETMKTNVDGLFAGGDSADDGPTVVIDAIADGQKAARAIHAYLTGGELPGRPFVVRKEFWSKPGKAELGEVAESPRHEVHLIDVEERRDSFVEVATGFEPEDNVHECARCLSCGCLRYYDCALRLYAEEYGIDMSRFKGTVRRHKVDDRHPSIVYDPNKCILCAKCVRTCARILPISALGLVGRGFRTEMRPALNDPLVQTSCVSCGNCIDSCPTGALTVKYPFPGRAALATSDVQTHCAFCSLACRTKVARFGGGRYAIAPSGVPGEYLCRYGRFGHELFIKERRITAAETRVGGEKRAAEIGDAARLLAAGMRTVAERHGSDSVAVFVSPDCTSEELYLASRIAREGFRTNNVASLSLLGTEREAGSLDPSFGFTASTADRSAIAAADLIICNNTALESDHLILAVEVIEAVHRGARLIVTNSTLDFTDEILSTLAMDPMRGRAALLWNGIVQILLDGGLLARDALAAVPGAAEFLAKRDVKPAAVAELTGIGLGDMEKAAGIIREAKRVVIIHSPDRIQDAAPGDLETLANLVTLLRAAGATANLLLPRTLSNSAAIEIAGVDPRFAAGRKPAPEGLRGARTRAELRKLLEEGALRAALIIGEDPFAWDRTAAWFRNVEFLAAIDWTPTETTRYADVVLPGSTFLETAGTRCTFEGTLVSYAQAETPPSGSSGVEILQGIAAELGLKRTGDPAAELGRIVRDSLGDLAPLYWNAGRKRPNAGAARLVPADTPVRTIPIQPPLTHGERYRQELREVGTERFKVR